MAVTCRDQLPTTRDDMLYDAPEAGYEVMRLHKRKPLGRQGVLARRGRQGGDVLS